MENDWSQHMDGGKVVEQSQTYVVPANAFVERPIKPKRPPSEEEYDEDCFLITHEKKYYEFKTASVAYFMKRTLRRHEFCINNAGRYVTPYLSELRARNEVAAMEFIRKNTCIPVPEVVLTFEDDGAFYVLTKRVEGVSMTDLSEDDVQVVCQHLDRYSQILSSFRSETIRSFVGEPCFPLHIAQALATQFPRAYVPSPTTSYVLCHGDFARQNIIVNPDNLEVAAVLDWECAGFYPPEQEVHFYRQPGVSGQQVAAMDCSTLSNQMLQLRA